MPTDSTRLKIIELLKTEHTATAADIAHLLNLSGAAVRYHLLQLERSGQVEVASLNNRHEPGRPANLFRLSQSSQPNFLTGLSSALLTLYLTQSSSASTAQIWGNLARQIAGAGPKSGLLLHRLSFSISELNRMNYQARWEAGAKGPRVLFSNCPYAVIWPQFPGLCQMDQMILELWIGRPLVQTNRIDFLSHKRRTCIFEENRDLQPATLQLA